VEPEVREAVDYVAVRRLQDAYADVVTRRAWPELPDLFAPDCEVVVDVRAGDPRVLVGPKALGEFIGRAIERFTYFQFVVLGTRVDVTSHGPDAASARLYMCELRQSADDGHQSIAYGVYHDDYVRTAGGFRFSHRRYHSLARTAPDLSVFPFPDVTS
jgi:SnoaL-like domain